MGADVGSSRCWTLQTLGSQAVVPGFCERLIPAHADSWADGSLAYYGVAWIAEHARPAPGFVIIYSNFCYAPGAGEGATRRQRGTLPVSAPAATPAPRWQWAPRRCSPPTSTPRRRARRADPVEPVDAVRRDRPFAHRWPQLAG